MNLKLDDEDEDKNKRGDGAKNRGIGGQLEVFLVETKNGGVSINRKPETEETQLHLA